MKFVESILEGVVQGYKLLISLIVIFFLVVGTVCACDAYGDTWTIDGGFKSIYDDYDDCIRNNLGTGTTEICNDEKQVKYRNR